MNPPQDSSLKEWRRDDGLDPSVTNSSVRVPPNWKSRGSRNRTDFRRTGAGTAKEGGVEGARGQRTESRRRNVRKERVRTASRRQRGKPTATGTCWTQSQREWGQFSGRRQRRGWIDGLYVPLKDYMASWRIICPIEELYVLMKDYLSS